MGPRRSGWMLDARPSCRVHDAGDGPPGPGYFRKVIERAPSGAAHQPKSALNKACVVSPPSSSRPRPRSRGQYHHLHRRRPRNHRLRSGLDAVPQPGCPNARSKLKSTLHDFTTDPAGWARSMPVTRAAFEGRCVSIRQRPRSTAPRSVRTVSAMSMSRPAPPAGHARGSSTATAKLWDRPDDFSRPASCLVPARRSTATNICLLRIGPRLHRPGLRHAGGASSPLPP